MRLCKKLIPLQMSPWIPMDDCAPWRSSISLTIHVLPFQRVSMVSQCCHDIGKPHWLRCLKGYYRVQHYEACDKIRTEIESRFNQTKLGPITEMENLFVAATNGDDCKSWEESCLRTDIDCGRLGNQLHLAHNAVGTTLPEVPQFTITRTACKVFNKTLVTKTLAGEVHKLSWMYMTLHVASKTSERTFSALRRLKNYLRSTLKQDRINNCLLMHCHKSITDTPNTIKITKKFACTNEQCKGHFVKFVKGTTDAHSWVKDIPSVPYVSKRFAATALLSVILNKGSTLNMFIPVLKSRVNSLSPLIHVA